MATRYDELAANGAPYPVFVPAEVAHHLSWDRIIGALEQVYATPQHPAAAPPRVLARGEGTWLRGLCAVPAGSAYMGAKIFGLSRNKKVNYVIVLFDQETSAVAGFVDGNHVTSRRTAGTSAVGVKHLAKAGPQSAAVLGTGAEARAHIEAIAAVRPLTSVRAYSTTPEKREAFARDLSKTLGVDVQAVDKPERACEGADIVIAAARSHGEKPILYGNWLAPEALVVSIGSTLPEQREIDISVVDACELIVCDLVAEVEHETGDMIAARAAGLKYDHKMVELTDLAAGKIPTSRTLKGRRMFKSVGSALQDVAVAAIALEAAREAGTAQVLPVSFLTKQAW